MLSDVLSGALSAEEDSVSDSFFCAMSAETVIPSAVLSGSSPMGEDSVSVGKQSSVWICTHSVTALLHSAVCSWVHSFSSA